MAKTTRTTMPAATAVTTTHSAVDALAATPTSGIVEVALDLIDAHPQNPRRDLGDLEELTESIRAQGVLQNVTLVPNPEAEGRFWALLGHRRIAAARRAGIASLPAGIRTDLEPAEQIALMLVENLQRTDLTPIEEGRSYQGLLDLGLTQVQIAEKTGRHRSTVGNRVKLASLDERADAAMREHKVTLEQAVELAELQEADPEAYAMVWEIAERQGALDSWAIRQGKVQAGARARQRAASEKFKAEGYTVIEADSAPDGAKRMWEIASTAVEHAECPGRAVMFYPGSDNAVHICIKPELHADAEPSAKTDPYEAARATFHAEIEPHLEAARQHRADWVARAFESNSPRGLEVREALKNDTVDYIRAYGAVAIDADDVNAAEGLREVDAVLAYATVRAVILKNLPLPTWYLSWMASHDNETAKARADIIRLLESRGYEPHHLETRYVELHASEEPAPETDDVVTTGGDDA